MPAMASKPSRLPAFFVATVALVFVLVVWGGIVRLSGSGLSIPEWPLAGGGRIIPPAETRVMIEFTHRVLAMAVGVCTLGLAVAGYAKPPYRSALGGLMGGAVVGLAVRIVMGGPGGLGGLGAGGWGRQSLPRVF